MKIKAAILTSMGAPRPYGLSRPLEIAEVDLQGPGPGEVLVKVAAAGLCHSDLSVIDGNRPRPLPMVLGHEASGVVAEVGSGVTDLTPGDHVIFLFVASCGDCPQCRRSRPVLCDTAVVHNTAGELAGGARRLMRDGQALFHHSGVSAFAEYATVSRRSLVRVEKDLPLDIAAVLGCAVITGAGAVFNTGELKQGDTTAIIGLGGVGLAAVMAARAQGAQEIIAVDLNPAKLAAAMDLGATLAVRADDPDAVTQIRDATGGGVDAALEFAGAVRAMELALAITARGGVTVTAGLPHPSSALAVPLVPLVAELRQIRGSYIGGGSPEADIHRLIQLYREGLMPIGKLLSRRLRLEEINEGFEALAEGNVIRQIIDFG